MREFSRVYFNGVGLSASDWVAVSIDENSEDLDKMSLIEFFNSYIVDPYDDDNQPTESDFLDFCKKVKEFKESQKLNLI